MFFKTEIMSWFHAEFGDDLEALILFGSQVSGEAHDNSDWDLLVVVKSTRKITRALYKSWDEITFKNDWGLINPHFVHYPLHTHEAHSLWLEVALNHDILWERDMTCSHLIVELKKMIHESVVRRALTHGQPYWVWNT